MILKHLKSKLSIKRLLYYFRDRLYPYRCPSCRRIVYGESFCNKCWEKLIFIEKPICSICGEPLDIKTNYSLVCARCLNKQHYFNKATSVFIYNRTIARCIYRLKFDRKTFLARFFTRFIVKNIKEFNTDYIVPVPIYGNRLKERGYNQSLLLVKEISKLTDIPYIEDLILKIKSTLPQTQLSTNKRKTNLKSAFKINEKYRNIIKYKNILIIDDVLTTGTTVDECAKVLKKNNVSKVFVSTIVRTTLNKKYKTYKNNYS